MRRCDKRNIFLSRGHLGFPRFGAARWRERGPARSCRIRPIARWREDPIPAAHSSAPLKPIHSGSRSRVPARTVCNSSTGCLTVVGLKCAAVAATLIVCPLRRRNKTRSEVSSPSPTLHKPTRPVLSAGSAAEAFHQQLPQLPSSPQLQSRSKRGPKGAHCAIRAPPLEERIPASPDPPS